MINALDDRLSQRQRAVLDAIRASHPVPAETARLATTLGIGEGRLNVTLRSLHRRGLILPAPTVRHHRGWAAPHAT